MALGFTGHRMGLLELRVPPLAVVVAFSIVMAVIAYLVPAAQIQVPAKSLVAAALGGAGAVVALAGVHAFCRRKTTVNPFTPDQSSSLVATGIYRRSRNPMYLGFLLALAGWGVFLGNWAAMLLLPAFIAYMNRFQIHPEERALSEKFGPVFATYAKAVRRWL